MSEIQIHSDEHIIGFVYIIKQANTDGPFKIGRSSDDDVRRGQLQAGNPNDLVVVHRQEVSLPYAPQLEEIAKRLLREFRVVGRAKEWFNVPLDKAQWAITYAAGYVYGNRDADKHWLKEMFSWPRKCPNCGADIKRT